MTEVESMQPLTSPLSHSGEKNLDDYKLGINNVIYQVSLAKDGELWCALIGRNLEDGISGFGESVQAALHDLADRIQK